MRIEVSKHYNIGFRPEVRVRVLTTEVIDWPRVEAKLPADDLLALEGKSLVRYIPHHVTEEERVDHNYSFDEMWIFA